MPTNPTDNMTIDEFESAAATAKDILQRRVEQIEAARATQPQRLTEARAKASVECTATLEEEPWTDAWTACPVTDGDGSLSGMMALPSIDGKELWGCRLAYDILDAGTDRARVEHVLDRYFTAIGGTPDHMFLVFSAALCTVAENIVPVLLDSIENQGGNYDARVHLAEAAANAWAVRIDDARKRFDAEHATNDDPDEHQPESDAQ
ncbi:hypothetical protein MB901379_03587 [Mycobacterium basiliense]|uniref:Uncharacterized protein n=1 Tax=Mycobacterium basiliense TaxID=2094119 RepID=A0A3S4BK67_9MYCO|nr:hypothetical protein [Mycobacterium basiliense]VDM89994.1 hypothetical protein MB901379_03587 [Mycobacterium basiliense]